MGSLGGVGCGRVPMVRHVTAAVQRSQPISTIEPRVTYTLTVDRLRPVIRIAHRYVSPQRIGPRVIVDHELFYVLSGEGVYRTADVSEPMTPGTGLLVPPFVSHVVEIAEPLDHLAVHFDLAMGVPPRTTELEGREPYEVRLFEPLAWPRTWACSRDHAYAQAMERIIADFASDGRLGVAAANARLTLLLLDLLRGTVCVHDRGHTNRSRLERAAQWLEHNLHRDISPDDLASAARLSPSHFRRLFREWAGMSASDYIQRARIARARQLMKDPDLTVKQVARMTGFADPFHFSRVFRKIDGLSPTQFREEILAGRLA